MTAGVNALGSAPEIVERVRQCTDLPALIGRHVRLVPIGPDYQGPCPFHPDDNRSFCVSSRGQFYYCFGCEASGDVFRFLMKFQSQTFWDAVRQLASSAGVDLEEATSAMGAGSC